MTAALGSLLAAALTVPPPAWARSVLLDPRGDLAGEIQTYVTRADDTLVDLAHRFDVGFVALVAANPGVDAWVPGSGTRIAIPTRNILPDAPRRGIVVNLVEQRLYYFSPDGKIAAFPIGTGRPGWDTPLVTTHVSDKRTNPSWIPSPSTRADDPTLPSIVPPGPNNPLGDYALYLALPMYLIHGTNRPEGVGRRVSRGCIRLYPEDIAWLYPRVPIGTPVAFVDQSMKLGWADGILYLQAHPDTDQALELERSGRLTPTYPPGFRARIGVAARDRQGDVDWPTVLRTLRERRGIPVPILRSRNGAAPR